MTHEADTMNLRMSLRDDAAEAALSESVNRIPRTVMNPHKGRSEREIRMSFGCWSLRDKQDWECITCTFVNQPLFLSCEMCGQARPAEESGAAAPVTVVGEQVVVPTPEEQHAMILQQEQERLKQERIKEIMAMQEGIFKQIRQEHQQASSQAQEEQQDQSSGELESSFAWMDLEDTQPISELPASRFSYGHVVVGKKASDASNSTLSTAATSCSQLSSAGHLGNQSWLDNSSYHSHSTRHAMDNSSSYQSARLMDGSSYQSVRTSDGTGRRSSPSSIKSHNTALPAQKEPCSLREDSARSSFLRGALHKGSSTSHANQSGLYVDFASLKAAVEGVSVRSFVLDETTTDHHVDNVVSPFGGALEETTTTTRGSRANLSSGSSHSMGFLPEESETSPKGPRRVGGGALNASLPELLPFQGDEHQAVVVEETKGSIDQDKKRAMESSPRKPSIVGALSVSGGHFSTKSIKNGLGSDNEEEDHQDEPQQSSLHADLPAAATTTSIEIPVSPVRADTGHYLQDHGLWSSSSPPPSHRQSYPDALHHDHDETHDSAADKRSSLSRLMGARKIPTPSLIPAHKKLSLPAANDPVFQRNLYAIRKQDKGRATSPKGRDKTTAAAAGSNKVTKSIPLLNRMLRKKSHPSSSSDTTGAFHHHE